MSDHVTDPQLAVAVSDLQRLVSDRAEALRRTVGFGYRPSSSAPGTFEELQREHRACRCSGLPLRVSSEHHEATVMGVDFDLAFRYWHDLTHVILNQDFTRHGEIAVGQEQLRQAAMAGHRPGSLPWRLLFAETIGQTECCYRLGAFPNDLAQFTREYLDRGLPEAIQLEARRQHLVIVRGFQRRRAGEVIGSRHHRPPSPLERRLLGDESSALGDAA